MLGGVGVGSGRVLLTSLFRAELEHWSDVALLEHHQRSRELILGRTSGESTPEEDRLVVELHRKLTVWEIFQLALGSVSGVEARFYVSSVWRNLLCEVRA